MRVTRYELRFAEGALVFDCQMTDVAVAFVDVNGIVIVELDTTLGGRAAVV